MIFKDDLIRILNDHGFEYFIKEHAPLFTVEDSKALRGQIEGAHSKNLFLKDAKANFFLISIEQIFLILLHHQSNVLKKGLLPK